MKKRRIRYWIYRSVTFVFAGWLYFLLWITGYYKRKRKREEALKAEIASEVADQIATVAASTPKFEPGLIQNFDPSDQVTLNGMNVIESPWLEEGTAICFGSKNVAVATGFKTSLDKLNEADDDSMVTLPLSTLCHTPHWSKERYIAMMEANKQWRWPTICSTSVEITQKVTDHGETERRWSRQAGLL